MKLKTSCPSCTASLSVEADLVGKHAKCPKCRTKFVIEEVRTPRSAQSVEEAAVAVETIADGTTTAGAKRAGSAAAASGKTLGRFELQGVLGQGGFGRVYKAYDPQLDRVLALKVPTFGPQDVQKAKRFQKEAKAAAQLRHPNIVPTFDSGKAGNQFFIATQFIEGEPLSKATELGPVEPRLAAEWCAKIADALAYAHEMGIVHRDVKPHNVMLDARSEPQLMDFGLAKRVNEDSTMTSEGSLLGTPAYMAPEQARGDTSSIGPHTDQYAVGAILYELLSGQRAFEGAPHVVLTQIVSQEPPGLRSINPAIPQDLEAIAQKAMSKEIEGRYESCEELAADLRAWLRGDPTAARPITPRERFTRWAKRNRGLAAAFGGTAVALLLAAGLGVTFAVYQTKARMEISAAQETTAAALTTAETERDNAQKERDAAQQERDRAETEKERAEKERLRAEEQTKLVEEQRLLAEKRLEDAEANSYVTTFRLAEARWREGDGDKTVALLDQLRPKEGQKDRRGWEWNYLWNQSHSYVTQFGPSELAALGLEGFGSFQLPLVADANSLLYFSSYKIAVIDRATGVAKCRIEHTDAAKKFEVGCFSPDARWIFTGNRSNEVICWDAVTGMQRYLVKSPRTGRFINIEFSPDGQSLLTFASPQSAEGRDLVGLQVETWNPDDGTNVNSLDVPVSAGGGMRVSPDHRYLAAGRNLWDFRTGAHLRRLELKQLAFDPNWTSGEAYCFSPNGRSVAHLNARGLTVCDVETGQEQLVIAAAKPGRVYGQRGIAYSPDGDQIATYSDEGIKVWDCASGELQMTLRGTSVANSVTFSPDGRSIISAGYGDGTVTQWDAATGANDFQLEMTWPSSISRAMQLSCAAQQLRVVSFQHGPTVWDVESGEILIRYQRTGQFDPYTVRECFFCLSPDGRRAYSYDVGSDEIIAGANSQTLVARDVATGKTIYTVPAPGMWFGHPEYSHISADGRYLATTDTKSNADSKSQVWDLANGKMRQENSFKPVAIDATGARVVTGGGVWDVQNESLMCTFQRHGADYRDIDARIAAFSADGLRIAAVTQSGRVRILDAVHGQELQALREKVSNVSQVAFSPDGRRLLTATDAGTMQLWDLATGQELLTLTPSFRVDNPVASVAMSADGSRILCLYTDTNRGSNEPLCKYTCVVWDGRPESDGKARSTERAARSTLAYFRDRTKSQDELVKAIQADPTINEDVRAMAVRFASLPPPKIVELQP